MGNRNTNFLDWLQTLHSPIVDKMMLGITHLGDAGIFGSCWRSFCF